MGRRLGFSQIYDVDYTQTYSPTARMESQRICLAIATIFDLDVHVMDVMGAYLYAKLTEEIYIGPPKAPR